MGRMKLSMKLKRYFDNKSIIQGSLIKITISLFVFMILVAVITGQNYWQKEALRINYNLLSTVNALKSEFESHASKIESIKNNLALNPSQKTAAINEVLNPIVANMDKNLKVGYYDLELQTVLGSQQPVTDEILNKIGTENTYQKFLWNSGKDILFVNLPLYDHQEITGYVYAYFDSNYILTNEMYEMLSAISILALSISVVMLYSIQKHYKQMEKFLNVLCEMIVNEEVMDQEYFVKLPELKPVLIKIAEYTDDLKRINLELDSTKQRLMMILEGIADGLYSLDRNWNFTYVNKISKRLLNHNQEILGRNFLEVMPEPEGTLIQSYFQESVANNMVMHWEMESQANPGQYFEYHAYPFEEGLIVFFRDITELKRQNLELARLERLNIIGQLAAGISHEIRNPLTTVKGFLQLMGLKPAFENEKENLNLMLSEIDRANGMITNYLSLSKSNAKNFKYRQLNEIIQELFPMLHASAKIKNKEITLDLGRIQEIFLNEDEIKQLILNIVQNGVEITPEYGTLTIKTYPDENKAVLAISDQGTGIPPEIQDKIGTPFFTTKESGTGLGLALSIGITRGHNAEFRFDTGEDGTTFYFIFPTQSVLLS